MKKNSKTSKTANTKSAPKPVRKTAPVPVPVSKPAKVAKPVKPAKVETPVAGLPGVLLGRDSEGWATIWIGREFISSEVDSDIDDLVEALKSLAKAIRAEK